MKTIMYHHCYERDYVNFENDAKHTSLDAINVTHHIPKVRKSFGTELPQTSLHCS